MGHPEFWHVLLLLAPCMSSCKLLRSLYEHHVVFMQARLVCERPQPDSPPQPGRPYLLHGLRLAVHFRRGDIAENKRWADRMLSPYYFINVVKQIMQVRCSRHVGGSTAECMLMAWVLALTPQQHQHDAQPIAMHRLMYFNFMRRCWTL
jgi:hypothetical protein